ncbi:group XIIB secretory phospholipase A2-like protein isoform X1 [Anopheles bellator]|uniref:group XIIB secretory phospholipase A2-like protein isoform X1 n=1 Tax=Anopheles bellator TaxID=139047 RepID=UPI0026478188|nr:group XIIB secretory phospholipase A2-like protein isoform X1 [Anopheles bellator]
MQIPYMKVAIYSLTFLTYAYTGYGSNMIANLRDAIIAAEAVFGDVMKNVLHVARKFKVVHEVFDAAVDENCIYKCPGGDYRALNVHGPGSHFTIPIADITPARNKFYVPQSDGCGSLGMKISTEYLPAVEMEQCCNAHDICYDTCNNDKELCDLDFKRCLYRYCDDYEKNVVTDIVVKGCKAAAKMLFTGTLTLGCKSYLDAQQRSCYCPPEKSDKSDRYAGGEKGQGKDYREKDKGKDKSKYGWKEL